MITSLICKIKYTSLAPVTIASSWIVDALFIFKEGEESIPIMKQDNSGYSKTRKGSWLPNS